VQQSLDLLAKHKEQRVINHLWQGYGSYENRHYSFLVDTFFGVVVALEWKEGAFDEQ
jgi:hypothetical protein